MKVYKVEQRTPEWHSLRRGKITGTGLKKILGTASTRNTYFMEVLAARLSVDDGQEETASERGNRLEERAISEFEKASGKIVSKVGFCESDENQFIASSPDGLIENDGKYTEAVEVKCLSSANHIKAWLDNAIPEDHIPQCLQYFIVNPELETLYFVLYDPRVTIHPLHIIEMKREKAEAAILAAEEKEKGFIKQIESKIEELIKL